MLLTVVVDPTPFLDKKSPASENVLDCRLTSINKNSGD